MYFLKRAPGVQAEMTTLLRALLATAALTSAAAQSCGGFRQLPCPTGPACTFTPDNGARVGVARNGLCLPCGRAGAGACLGACPPLHLLLSLAFCHGCLGGPFDSILVAHAARSSATGLCCLSPLPSG